VSLFLKGGTYIDWQTAEMRSGNIRVEEGDGGMSFIGEPPGAVGPGDRLVDCSGRYVTRAFGCGHHHIYSALSRGMPAPAKSPGNFREILRFIWWRLDKALNRDSIRASALVTALYCLKNGVTFVIDHHSSPGSEEGSLDIIAESLEEAGMTQLLCYEISDRDGPAAAEAGLAETKRYLEKRRGLVGLHASFTVGNTLFRDALDAAERFGTGIHIHTAEDDADQEECLKTYGKRVVERYRDLGLLDLTGNILTHCLYLSPEEWRLVEESGSWVATAPESNLNNGVGIFNSPDLSNIMLSTDGMHSDMLRSAKVAYFLAQGGAVPVQERKTAAAKGYGRGKDRTAAGVYERFRSVHRYVKEAGISALGDNDLVVLKYDSPTELPRDNFFGHFIYGIESRHVESVVSSGRLVVEKGKVLTLDEEAVLAFAREQASALWERMVRME